VEDERATVHGHKGAVPEDARWELPEYTHGRELGSGASGRVVLAHHDATGTPVAIKYLSGEAAGNESFRAEAELLGRLHSPYVTGLYEYVEGPRGAAIVMELVDGIALRTLLREEGATEPEAALTVLKGSLLGLAAAHAAGVVHRDYKPGNVLVAADGSSKLVDFGIAVPQGDSADIAGTPAYMAPEQWAGSPASPSADVYAATATFFECLTGAKPYAGTTLLELAVQHTEAAVPDDQAPEALRPLIRAGLAKTPQERPESAAALVTQLEAVASAAYGEDWEERGRRQLTALVALLPLLLPTAGGHVAGTTALATTTLAPPVPQPGPRLGASRRAKLLAAATAVVILAGTFAGVAAAGNTDDAGHTTVTGPAPELTSTLAPPPTASPSAALPTPSPSASTVSPSPSASPTPTQSPSPTQTHASATPSASPSPSPSPTVSAPSLHVISIVLEAYGCYGRYGTVASVTVITDGAADGKLTLSWIDRSGRTLQTQAVDTITLPKGKTQISNRYTHTFGSQDAFPTWGVRIATDPAADKGQNTYRDLYAQSCNPPR